jgi:hypothetical protein
MFTSTLIRIFAGQQLTSTFAGGTALNLYRDFINDSQLNGPVSNFRIGPDLTFIRNSFASFYTSDGTLQIGGFDTPRFDHNPINNTPLGLLIEGTGTNLVEFSNNFTGSTWITPTSGITVTSNVPGVFAPDNTETVTLITPTTSSGFHVVSWGGAPAPWSGNPTIPIEYYNRSIFIKQQTARYIVFSVSPEPSALAGGTGPEGPTPDFESISNIFDFDTQQFIQLSLINTNVTPLSGGWFRIDIGRNSSNLTVNRFTIGLSQGPNFEDTYFTGIENNLSGVYIWGAQVEKGLSPTSYIPSNGTQVSRAGDNVTLSKNPFGKIYNPEQSTLLVQGKRNSVLQNNTFATFINRDQTKFWSLNSSLSTDRHNLAVSTLSSVLSTETVMPYVSYKLVAALQDNDYTLLQDGIIVGQLSGVGLLPGKPVAINQFQLGRFGNNFYLNGYIEKFGYWPTRLVNSQLTAI